MPFIRIIPNVLEVTINGQWTNERQVSNVFHLHNSAGWEPIGATDPSVGALIVISEWQEFVLPQLPNNYTVSGTSFIDLTSASGAAGTTGVDVGFGVVGGQAGSCGPPNVSILVRKNTVSLRNQRPGRTYLVGALETDVDEDGSLTPAKVTATNTAFASFLANVNQVGPPDLNLVVPHIQLPGGPPPEPPVEVVGTFSDITSFTTDTVVATQRRRLRS